MKNKTKLIIWVIIAILAVALCGFLTVNVVSAKTKEVKNPVATFEVENYGNIKIELYPEYAPNTVSNFINLIQNGFYTGKTFYGKDINAIYATRNADGTNVEPTMDGSEEGVKYQINGEFVANGFEQNTLKHEKGVVSMLREEYSSYFGLTEQGYNSASAHFQIMLDTNRNLNGSYAAFGKVIEGLDVVEKIFASDAAEVTEATEDGGAETNSILDFLTPAVITNASVETYGVNYGVPETHEAFDYSAFLQSYFNQYYTSSEVTE